MAQAPAKHGVRESGVHWVNKGGHLKQGPATFLDGYLRQLGYSVDPQASGCKRPYTTNALHCWTGPGDQPGKDREPSDHELQNCEEWWLKEFELVRPKVVILLGAPAAKSFAYACGDPILGKLAGKPFATVRRDPRLFRRLLSSQGDVVQLRDLLVRRYVVPHPSNWQYRGREEIYQKVAELVRDALGRE
jgi:uracil-DNA glycosylase